MIPEVRYRFYDRKPAPVDVREEVLEGLRALPKRLSPKYFYDQTGSQLFEAITELPEYYLTRTEIDLIEAHREEIARRIGDGACLIEYGSGNSRKIRLLLEQLRPACYVPVDISAAHLEASALQLHSEYPWLNVYPVCADFSQGFELPDEIDATRRLAFFPGSSIGNFDPQDAVRFMRGVAGVLGPGCRFLIGVDRKKDRSILERAYNDPAGLTAEFNLNALRHLNDVLEADFDVDRFSHLAVYDEDPGCVRMFLESAIDQVVHVDGVAVEFDAGERVHTEDSFKYDPEEFTAMAEEAGFLREAWWTDPRDLFAIYLLKVT